jgi:hypothetical protein
MVPIRSIFPSVLLPFATVFAAQGHLDVSLEDRWLIGQMCRLY